MGFSFPAYKIQNMTCSKAAMESLNKFDEKTRRTSMVFMGGICLSSPPHPNDDKAI